jgi:hypothetical protein
LSPPAIWLRASASMRRNSSGAPAVTARRNGPRRSAATAQEKARSRNAIVSPTEAHARSSRSIAASMPSRSSAASAISSIGQRAPPSGPASRCSSNTAWKLVPPKPKALTPARRGAAASRSQGSGRAGR